MPRINFLESINDVANNFDAFIVDLWGVIHDGRELYPGVRETLWDLRKKNKEIVFLSNAPRRAWRAEEGLTALGITRDLYDEVITSGEAAFRHLTANPIGKAYYYIGPERDAGLLNDSPYVRVKMPEKADFAIVTGFDEDDSGLDEKMPELEACRKAGLIFICTNPDMEIVRQDGTRALCAGVMAKAYAEMGGEVRYFGKPHQEVYNHCFAILKTKNKDKIAAIGDNLETDIKGANAAEIYSILVTGGVMGQEFGGTEAAKIEAICENHGIYPSAAVGAFR